MKETNSKLKALFLVFFISLGCLACSEDDDVTEETPIQEPTLEASPASLSFEASEQTRTVEISSNSNWEITTSSLEWITVTPLSGEEDATVNLTVASNENTEARSGSIIITSGDISREVSVSQEATEEAEEDVESNIPPDDSNMRNLTSVELTAEMGVGWNLGNSLEAIGGETAWGNPIVSKRLIDSVKNAGFDAVRIPVAWSKFSDEANFEIRESWMQRVKEVVNYVLDNDMYAIVNIHWDNGWMQPTYEDQEYVNDRLEIMWKQIAINFRDYDDRLLFAGTNEVMVEGDYGTPTEEYYTVQNSFNQTFVDAVRETGGRNHYRHLVVQGFNTNIDHTVNFAEIPEDVLEERLMVEVHYYDPYDFTLNENSDVYEWGENAENSQEWANESFVDEQFNRMKTNFIDKGIGVILGEYGAMARLNVEDHAAYRKAYVEYVTDAALEYGLVPFYWDNGFVGDHGFALFDRDSGAVEFPEILKAIVE
ncbi:hypothetical protein APR41_01430 [Salegentibacter salinarum]|uniref:Endoglucanase n=1 Tax=Salegentibacter salinarum TaxID=447422 RepID=A0A2N0U3X8_9FLAO|nr:cellulase family glycosylhydrolase [Salegentibacter salinarum]PKD21675.1 hypothetical protein APR41_01430 [Salegentibacter salinarum]SKB34994.1 endoglucanase [Salegentibacter salinarum]